jgi:hypothetical protein
MRERLLEARRAARQPDQGRDSLTLLLEVVRHVLGATLASGQQLPPDDAPRYGILTEGNLGHDQLSDPRMALGYSGWMAALRACPFCRKLFTSDEGSSCPDCDIALVAMSQLPPSLDALEEEAEQGQLVFPENQPLPPTYMGRGRGALLLLSGLGLFAFFLPWVELTAPESAVYSAFDLARGRAGFLWGGATAWLVMMPLVITRRTIARMRGVRVVTALFAAMTLSETLMLWLMPPRRGLTPLELHFRYGLFLSAGISLVAMLVAARLGGSLDNLPKFLLDTRQPPPKRGRSVEESSRGQTLH